MGPPRKSRNVNKRYSYINEVSPKRDEDVTKRSSSRKRKLADMLGPRWSTEELTRFYDSYRKNGKDWKKVAGAVRNRSPEMIEALYTMNKAYLSLPHGTASSAGLIAMMTDHYSNFVGSDSDQESNDAAGSSRRSQKRARGRFSGVASKDLDEQYASHSLSVAPNYECLSLLKKKRTGTRPRPVGKRTPRFPVAVSHEITKAGNYSSSNKLGLKSDNNAGDDEVAHKIAMALTEASQRVGSPQISGTPSRIAESVMSSPFRNAQRKVTVNDVEGSTEADGELKSPQKGRKHEEKKIEADFNSGSHSDDIKEECSGTEEGLGMDTVRNKFDYEADVSKIYNSLRPSQSKKALFSNESKLQIKDEENRDHVDESAPVESSPPIRAKRKSSGIRMKGCLLSNSEVFPSKMPKNRKGAGLDDRSVLEGNQNSHLFSTKTRKNKKTPKSKVQKMEINARNHVNGSPGAEAGDQRKQPVSKNKKTLQSGSAKLMKAPENTGDADARKEGIDAAQSPTHIHSINQVTSRNKVKSSRKTILKKPEVLKDLNFSEKISSDMGSLHETAVILKDKLCNCLSNPLLRRFCTFEWFYSAIDYPWFAKREFDEYLHHVGLGHVPRLTHVEWSFIRSSLGKPRRFSQQFLKQEKAKLNLYRDSVRKHYTELREGVREGLPTDLSRPLSVGQRVVAIHPKTREIHDGNVLTVDHNKCRVQFNRNELGVEFVTDIDCMPLNPIEYMPPILGRQSAVGDTYFESSNEQKANGRASEYENLDNINCASAFLNPPSSLKEAKTRSGLVDAYSQAKEADVRALALLNRGLKKKEAIVMELRRMNDEILESQACDGDLSWKGSEPFKKQYAAVLIQLSDVNEQVSSALHSLRERNAYQGRRHPLTDQPGSHLNDIMESSRTKAQSMVNAAIQAILSLKGRDYNVEETIDFVNERIPLDDDDSSSAKEVKNFASSEVEAQIPRELIAKCVATLIMIQKCTERQFPPCDVAQILDSAVTSLQPRSSNNLPVYGEIQKCVGIIKNQILALIP
ncbi:hypothetical protein M569_00315, partial [Genlisea aurea]